MSNTQTLTDLYVLVNNLQSSVNSVNSSFTNLQSNINSLNAYDTLNSQNIASINTVNTQQNASISTLQNVDTEEQNRLTALEAKFPITNSSILDGTISKSKITGLVNDLATINTNITLNANNLTALQSQEAADILSLTANLNTEKTAQANNYNTLSSQISSLTGSVPGSNNTFQIQIDTITNNITTETNRINANITSINNLNTTTANHTTRLTNLEMDNSTNKVNIQTNTSNIQTNTVAISGLTTNLNTLTTNLTNLTTKETTDITGLQQQITDLSNTITTTNASINTNISNLSTTVDNNLSTLNNRYTTLNNLFTTNYATLTNSLNTLTAKQTADYNTINDAITAQNNKEITDIATLNAQITQLSNNTNTRFSTNETNITNNTTNIATNTTDINTLKTRLTTDELNITAIQTDITTLQNSQTTIIANITQNTADITALQSDNALNKANITTNKNDITTIKQYNITNTANLATINSNIAQNTADITAIKTTTIPSLDSRYVLKTGDTITGTLNVTNIDSLTNLNIGASASSIVIGSLTNTDNKVILIGGPNDTVNINGSLNNIQTTNLEITDKIITLNKGASGTNTSGNSGIYIRDNNNDTQGYIRTSSDSTAFEFKPPQSEIIFKIKETPTDAYDLVNKLTFDNGISNLQSQITSLNTTTTGLSNQITTINSTLSDNIPFSKINSFPSNANNVLLGDGTFGKITNAMIPNGTITTDKLSIPNDPTKFLFGDGTFKTLPPSNDPTFDPTTLRLNQIFNEGNVDINNYKVINVANGTNNTDAINLGQANSLINAAKFDPTTLRLNNITTNGDINVNNFKITNLANGIADTDAINLGQAKTILQNLNTYVPNGSINLNKISFTGNGTKFLADDGTYKSFISNDYVNPLLPTNGIYTYTGQPVLHIDDINFNYFGGITNKSPFVFVYDLYINGVVTKMKVSCIKDFILSKISQSCFTTNTSVLTVGTASSYYPNDDSITVYPNTDNLGLLANGSCYFDTSSTSNNLDASSVVNLTISNNIITSTSTKPQGYLASFNNILTAGNSSFVAFPGTNYNLYFDKTRYYIGNETNQFSINNWNTDLTNYLSDVNGFQNNVITVSDGINSFMITKNNSDIAYYVKINLNTGVLISTTLYNLVYPFIISSLSGYYDQTINDGRGVMLFSVDGAISYVTNGNSVYFKYGGSNTIFRHLQILDNDGNILTLPGSVNNTEITTGTSGPDIFGLIDNNNNLYFIDKGHEGTSALSTSNTRNLLNYSLTNIKLLKY